MSQSIKKGDMYTSRMYEIIAKTPTAILKRMIDHFYATRIKSQSRLFILACSTCLNRFIQHTYARTFTQKH